MGWMGALFRSSIGRKATVAVTGLGMVLFLIGHMLGNLRAFEGPESLNSYAEFLRIEPPLLWTIRIGLLVLVLVHAFLTVTLTLENSAARPRKYVKAARVESTVASRTMIYGGIALALYVVYHILHFTTRSVHRTLVGNSYMKGGEAHVDVYANVVQSFQNPVISVIYIVAQVFLFLHLVHGVQSALRTLGVNHPTYVTMGRRIGIALALIICVGFTLVPVGVLAGIIKPVLSTAGAPH